jgi:hypothetical protein
MTVKVPVSPATPCTVNNNSQILKAPPGTLLNIFNNDDFGSASAQFQTVVKPDGTFICAWPAMGGGEPPLANPPAKEPEEEPEEPEQECPQGWTKTPVPGKCCPHGTAWDGERCQRGATPPEPEPEPEPEEPTTPPALTCWDGWLQIDADETKAYIRKGYKVGPRRSGKRVVWCAKEETGPQPALDCPAPAVGKLPYCKCGPGYTGKWPKCRKVPDECPKGYTGEPPNCRKLPDKCPDGYVGSPPNCKKEPPADCPKGYVGTPPNCRKIPETCPKGYVGKPPHCRKLPVKCPSGYLGTPPNCKRVPPKTCPEGFVGKPPKCKKVNVNKLLNLKSQRAN